MVQAHKGYFQEDGRFISADSLLVRLPINKQVTILWDVEATETNEERLTPQRTAAGDFLTAMRELRKGGFTSEDEAAINDLQSGQYKPVFEERL